MTPVQAHLFLNHVPIVGLMFGLVFLLVAMRRSSEPALLASLRIFVAMGLIATLVAGSGLVAASTLQGAVWLDARAVSRHQVAGLLTLAVLLVVAAVSAVAVFASSRNGRAVSARVKRAVVALAVFALGMGLWTSELGGAIRHTELVAPAYESHTSHGDIHAEGGETTR